MDHPTFLPSRPGPSGQLWNQILQLLGGPLISAVGEQLGEALSVLGIRGLSVQAALVTSGWGWGGGHGGRGACLIVLCAEKRNQRAVCTNVYLQKNQVTYDTGFLHTVV